MSDGHTSSATLDALDVLRIAVSHGLPGAELPAAAAAADHQPALSDSVIALADAHRVQGLLWRAVEHGAVHADEPLRAAARDALTAALRACLEADTTALTAVRALTDAGVETRVLKGVALARLDYGDPSERAYGDADLLVRRDDCPNALVALQAAGFQRAHPPVRPGWEQRFGKAIVLRAPSGGELDLHLAITGGYFAARIDHAELWERPGPAFDLGGVPAHGLDPEGRLLHACCHSVLGGGSGLRALRDVAQLVLISGADWELAVARATRDGIESVLAAAVRATWTDLGLDHGHPLVGWAARCVPDPAQVRAFAGYRAARDEGWAPEGLGVLQALGPSDRIRYLAGLAVPTRASLRARGRTRREHLRLGLAAFRHRG